MSLPSRSIQSPRPVDPPRSSESFRPLRTRRALGRAARAGGRGPFQFHVNLQFVLFLRIEELERHGLGGLNQELPLARQDLREIDRTPATPAPKATRDFESSSLLSRSLYLKIDSWTSR